MWCSIKRGLSACNVHLVIKLAHLVSLLEQSCAECVAKDEVSTKDSEDFGAIFSKIKTKNNSFVFDAGVDLKLTVGLSISRARKTTMRAAAARCAVLQPGGPFKEKRCMRAEKGQSKAR